MDLAEILYEFSNWVKTYEPTVQDYVELLQFRHMAEQLTEIADILNGPRKSDFETVNEIERVVHETQNYTGSNVYPAVRAGHLQDPNRA